jgi:hypothetical protein
LEAHADAVVNDGGQKHQDIQQTHETHPFALAVEK